MVDLVIVNGRVITFAGADAEALAVKGGIIVAVGRTDEILALAGSARVFDAQGCTVLPGFIDSHVHLFGGSAELDCLDLTGVVGADALRAAVQPYAATRKGPAVVFATAMDYALMGDRAITRHDLDAALPDRPFAAMAADHHTVWANTMALEQAGLLYGREVALGSEVVMGRDGLASGMLCEPGAFEPVLRLTALAGRDLAGFTTGADPVPTPRPAERSIDKAVIAKGLQHCASHGITGLHNMDGNFYQLELLSEMETEGTLLCRVESPMHLKQTDPLSRIEEAVEMRARFASDMVWSSRVKMFMDGVIDSKTAFMLEPYPGTDDCSAPLFAQDHFDEACRRIDGHGLQIAVHAIGDGAVRATLDGYAAARAANGVRDSRHRIEHIETIHAEDLPRIAELGAVASFQPLHAPRGGLFPVFSSDLVHEGQIATAFAWQSIRETGAKVIFSTDWPVVPVDVMPSVQAAVAGIELPAPWVDQRQGLRDTLASYTRDNAWVEFNEHRKGVLAVGMMADLVVMDHDLEAMESGALGCARAALTVCGGRITFER